ncbi:MIR motif [Pseudocohnilembus persalinus]|uniref:MIR motif n=1 Tax=Pseudocohnilembus persalinus TaxID=266149 RepID=A0A0V0QYX9_PSEPJ|nr:MIR motif [Pseudocohnilembus persalinus]|eukprot:KRX07545.1 MIR motif [Pseudocohnilembus persalinus]
MQNNIQNSLHSHDVSYGSGSKQQSVTGFKQDNDYNSLWTIKDAHNGDYKTYRDEVKCGDLIRLEHTLTKKNLHSHHEKSPLSHNQEVSCYGIEGDGDEADNWVLECIMQDEGATFKGNTQFYLRHKLTGKLLSTNKKYAFTERNCGRNCPIEGQLEVSSISSRNADSEWKIVGGVFFQRIHHDFEWEKSDSEDDTQNDESEVDYEGYKQTQAKARKDEL